MLSDVAQSVRLQQGPLHCKLEAMWIKAWEITVLAVEHFDVNLDSPPELRSKTWNFDPPMMERRASLRPQLSRHWLIQSSSKSTER